MAPVPHSLEKIGRNLVTADFYTLVEKVAEDVVEDVFGIVNDHWSLPSPTQQTPDIRHYTRMNLEDKIPHFTFRICKHPVVHSPIFRGKYMNF